MFSTSLIIIAVALRLLSGADYVRKTLAGKAKPNPITWFCWALTSLVSFAAQMAAGASPQAIVTLSLALGPLCIFGVSVFKNRRASDFSPTNISCGILSIIGIILWQLTDSPITAIVFSIFADIAGSVPTLTKTYKDPHSEPKLPYIISMLSMTLTVLSISDWSFECCIFPIYIFCINAAILCLAQTKFKFGRKITPLEVTN